MELNEIIMQLTSELRRVTRYSDRIKLKQAIDTLRQIDTKNRTPDAQYDPTIEAYKSGIPDIQQ